MNIFTFLGGAAAFAAFLILRATLHEAHEATTSARQQANAAANQARTAQRQLQITDRPWLGVGPPVSISASFPFHAEQTEIDIMQLMIKNFGKSVALKTKVTVTAADNSDWLDKVAGPTICDYFPALPGVQTKDWGIVLFPDQDFNEGPRIIALARSEPHPPGYIPPPPGTEQYPPIKEVWLIGCIRYMDQLGLQHWTRFCFIAVPQIWDADVSTVGVRTFEPYYKYNDTDIQQEP